MTISEQLYNTINAIAPAYAFTTDEATPAMPYCVYSYSKLTQRTKETQKYQVQVDLRIYSNSISEALAKIKQVENALKTNLHAEMQRGSLQINDRFFYYIAQRTYTYNYYQS
jgi:hypothetical protein